MAIYSDPLFEFKLQQTAFCFLKKVIYSTRDAKLSPGPVKWEEDSISLTL